MISIALAATTFTVRVGHIGAMNAMPNSDKILEISRAELWKDGILADDFDIEIITQMGCGESFEGVAVAADMFHLQQVKAFIGPYCNAELDAVAKMAAYWNVPIIGYMASGTAFVDKTIYKTLARVSLRTTNSLAEAVAALLRHFNWKKVQNLITVSFLVYSVNSEKSIPFEYQQG
uniref:ANF_receptor domain-containing protein n=1 Tax=Ascaris lumbricoides TaxID=6252 RepID=A0A0M3I0J2_ASCLU